MRKIIFVFVSFLTVGLLASCSSTKKLAEVQEPVEKTTFLDTYVHADDGKIFTCYIFSKITRVCLLKSDGSFGPDFSPDSYEYDKSTTELKIKEKLSGGTDVHIEGVYTNPPHLILRGMVADVPKPCVMAKGKMLHEGEDYEFDFESGKLDFITELDVDEDSFLIMWIGESSEILYGNKIEEFEREYEQLMLLWSMQMANNTSGDVI